jgi:hypothetical protein
MYEHSAILTRLACSTPPCVYYAEDCTCCVLVYYAAVPSLLCPPSSVLLAHKLSYVRLSVARKYGVEGARVRYGFLLVAGLLSAALVRSSLVPGLHYV